MVRGLFTAWTGLQTEQKRLDVISNNIANSATVGYKTDNVTSQSFDNVMTVKIRDTSENNITKSIGTMSTGVKLGEVYTDYSQGSLKETENQFDLAISGKGFFAVNVTDANGDTTTKYTRDGQFTMSSDGYLMDSEGNILQGESGDIQIDTSTAEVVIDTDGSIYADGEYVDTVSLTDFEDYSYLEKYADNLYTATDGATTQDTTATIVQGYTEQSNVNVVSEMVDMITITRAYEANQKVMQTIDSSLDQVVNSVGKV